MENIESVRVVVRCRPLLPQEIQDQAVSIVKVNHIRSEVSITNPKAPSSEDPKIFSFDDVFNSETSQKAIYNQVANPIVNSVLQGLNGTIFAYGQTSAGKTYTIQGIIPRALEQIFNHIESTPDKQFLVRVSFFEIYNEEVHDLLSRDPKNQLKVREKLGSGYNVKGLLSLPVESATDASQKLMTGNHNREIRLIRMSEKSSRSHLIFSITVESHETDPDGKTHIKLGKLNLVDLAGSEAQEKTEANEMSFKEAINMEKSFNVLENVISALANPNSLYISYRDSKLTMILQDSLGGNSKTAMIANLGPADQDYEETLHTLRYANRLKPKPRVNENPTLAFFRELQEEIEELKAQLEEEKEESVERERKKIEAQKDLPDADRQRLLADLAKREEAQQEDIEKVEKELEEERRLEQRFARQLDEEDLWRGRFMNIQHELEEKDRKIYKLSKKLQHAKAEMQELQEDFDEERALCEKRIYYLNSQLKHKDLINNSFIPQDALAKIATKSKGNEQEKDWILPNIHLPRESLRRPKSSFGSTRPSTGYTTRSLFSSGFGWNGRRSSDIKGALKIGIGQDEEDLEDMNGLNGLNLSDSDLEEEKETDHRKVDEKTRKIISGSKRVKSGRKRETERSNREEKKETMSLFEDDF